MIGKFSKISATGNDFILVDGRESDLKEISTELVSKLCGRRTGVGADGLIILLDSKQHDFRMKYFNADGEEVSMCGNGTRAISYYYLYLQGKDKGELRFETKNGVYQSKVDGTNVTVFMSEVYDENKIESSDLMPGHFNYYVNTGVPHLVFEVENLDEVDVFTLGRSFRYNSRFIEGVNTNFFEEKNNQIHLRTYERGVENETLACGTGACAVVVALYRNQRIKNSCTIKTLGGDLHFRFEEELKNLSVTGSIDHIYDGELTH